MDKLLIYVILILAFFANFFFQIGLPGYFAVGTEILIYFLLVLSLFSRKGRGIPLPHLWYSFFFMIIITACSVAINKSEILRSIYSLRLLYRFYFFYIALNLLELDDIKLKKLINFIGILLFLQLPFIAINFYKYGISEATIGAYSRQGGSLTAMLPIIVVFYASSFYFLFRADKKYIILALAYIIFSIIGKKRVVAFIYPIQYVAIFYFIYIKGKNVILSKKVALFFLMVSTIIVVFCSALIINDSLNPEGKIGGSVDIKYATNYAWNYQFKYRNEQSVGRFSTTSQIFKVMWNSGIDKLLFGFGPGSTIQSIFDSPDQKEKVQRFFEKIKVAYGTTPMTKIVLEYGILGVITFSLIIFSFSGMCLKYYKKEKDPYWKAFAGGSIGFAFSMIFFFFAYHFPAFWGDTLPCLYFFVMAAVYTRSKKSSLSISTKY